MSKVTKLHPDSNSDSDILEETLGEVAVEAGFKLPETEAELDIYEYRLSSAGVQLHSRYSSIHEALANAETIQEVRYQIRNLTATRGSYAMAARNGSEIDAKTLDMINAAADEDDDD